MIRKLVDTRSASRSWATSGRHLIGRGVLHARLGSPLALLEETRPTRIRSWDRRLVSRVLVLPESFTLTIGGGGACRKTAHRQRRFGPRPLVEWPISIRGRSRLRGIAHPRRVPLGICAVLTLVRPRATVVLSLRLT